MPPKPTTKLLVQLRALMQDTRYVQQAIQAYIVPSNDAHDSEYLADCDKFRAFISGFTGSAGTAVVTTDHACLWTDGRYFLQASEQLDANWTLMKDGVDSTPTQGAWLSKTLPSGSYVGVDPKLYTYSMWLPLQNQLEASGHKLVAVPTNLIALIWSERPSRPANAVHPLALKFTGKRIAEKLEGVRAQMVEKNAGFLVLSALDEIAWLLNLRGSDIEYNPVFFSYVVISTKSLILFLNPQQLSVEITEHLNNEIDGGVSSYEIKSYDQIEDYLKQINLDNAGRVWLSEDANYALSSLIPKQSLLSEITPVPLMKAVKNAVEIQGMRNAHIKDGVALSCYFAWLATHVGGGSTDITEISGAAKLKQFRSEQADFMGLSFTTISSVGDHGAIIHYEPSPSTDRPITAKELYLCDSGGQYRDGTTDVTRTFHFGQPTEQEKFCYTKVLKGQLKLAMAVFPSKIKGNCLDSFAREYLWEVGLDYAHGTGHGIGSYLNVHEGPMGISWRPIADDPGLVAGMFLSNEPGYYEDGKFGIRIEDIVQIVQAEVPYNFANRGYLTFDTITFCPKQTKLIVVDMLTDKELNYLNSYHKQCRDVLGPLLEQQGHLDAKQWLWNETEPIKRQQ